MCIYHHYIQCQSTLPHGERHDTPCTRPRLIIFQSTLPHGERRFDCCVNHIKYISIHAPTRGATAVFLDYRYRFFISIHAPTRGATNPFRQHTFPYRFQSTLPHGERHISLYWIVCYRHFNPRSHTGSDETKQQQQSTN